MSSLFACPTFFTGFGCSNWPLIILGFESIAGIIPGEKLKRRR
jgi:hypothetical protein